MGPLAMASLRNASPKLRSYFKENYIPQVCEVLEPLGPGVRKPRNRKRFPRGSGVGLGGEKWRKEERNGRGWCQLWTSGRSALKIQRRPRDG